jgi:hypothetical protein
MLRYAEPEKNDLVFFNGDMVSAFNSEQELFDGFMEAGIKAFAKNVPMYYARGNHETRGPFATSFQDYFSPPESRTLLPGAARADFWKPPSK